MGVPLNLRGLIDCTNEEYHAWPGVSKSKLDMIAISPLAYWDKYINPEREPEEQKHCFAVGDGTHKLVLEPGTFEHTYAVGFDKKAYPEALDTVADLKKALNDEMLMTNGAKPELVARLLEEANYPREKILFCLEQDHAARMAGKIAIPATDYKAMLRMLQAIERHHTAGHLIKNAMVEQSFFWTDQFGILRKCRTDLITGNGRFMGDLKTTIELVNARSFGRVIEQRRYHVQAAWYLDILKALYGRDAPTGFFFIVVQKGRPHDVSVQYLTEEQIEVGRVIYQSNLARLIECLEADRWPGVDNGQILQAQLSNFHINQVMAAGGH